MNQNALSIVLAQLRVSGAIVLSQAHPVPWSIRVPPGNALRDYLGVDESVTIVPFHIARRGCFELQPDHPGDEPILILEQQLVMCVNGQGHVMGTGNAAQTISFEQVMSNGSFETPEASVDSTEVICGVFMLRNAQHNPLVQSLPNLVRVDVSDIQTAGTMNKLYAMLTDELALTRPGQAFMLERVLELLYAQAIRMHAENLSGDTPNWLSAIGDERIGRAISFIHANLQKSITVEDLATLVSLSPSRFAARFRELVGTSPKAYISDQRQVQAANRLTETARSIQAIADECGYQSMPSFTKAFVKRYGVTPSQWRRSGSVQGQ